MRCNSYLASAVDKARAKATTTSVMEFSVDDHEVLQIRCHHGGGWLRKFLHLLHQRGSVRMWWSIRFFWWCSRLCILCETSIFDANVANVDMPVVRSWRMLELDAYKGTNQLLDSSFEGDKADFFKCDSSLTCLMMSFESPCTWTLWIPIFKEQVSS